MKREVNVGSLDREFLLTFLDEGEDGHARIWKHRTDLLGEMINDWTGLQLSVEQMMERHGSIMPGEFHND